MLRSSSQIGRSLVLGALSVAASFPCVAQSSFGMGRPEILKNVGIQQNLNRQLPLDAAFLDETGKPVQLGSYFRDGKPVVLAFVYYRCPMLCNLELDGLFAALKKISLTPGADYQVVAISIDPRENPKLAEAKRANYLKTLAKPEAAPGIHFLTGQEADVRRVADAAGFRYAYVKQQDQFAHASGIMVATPRGLLARYFYGIHYGERDLRLSLVEASENRIGSPADEILLFCFHYDPTTARYGLVIVNLLRGAGIAMFVGLLSWIIVSRRREKRAQRGTGSPGSGPSGSEQWRSV